MTDDSILIDLLKANLIETFFKFECEFHFTDFAVVEVEEENVGLPDIQIE